MKWITSTPRWLFGVEHSKLGAVFESMKRHDMLFLVLLGLEDYHTTLHMLHASSPPAGLPFVYPSSQVTVMGVPFVTTRHPIKIYKFAHLSTRTAETYSLLQAKIHVADVS